MWHWWLRNVWASPEPGSICHSRGRAISCPTGIEHYAVMVVLIVVGVVVLAFILSVIIAAIRGEL